MRMCSCRSGFGPGPSYPAGTATVVNGLAGPSISKKKKRQTTSIVSSAKPTSGSANRRRNFRATCTVKPARISDHKRIEPSRADHIVATLNSRGVRLEPLSCTKPTVKSRVMSARCIANTATTAPRSTRRL